jgi:hypothetical protein
MKFWPSTAKAAAEGKTVDDVADKRLRESMREQSWQALLARGRKYGEASGIPEDQVPHVVREWRTEHRGR